VKYKEEIVRLSPLLAAFFPLFRVGSAGYTIPDLRVAPFFFSPTGVLSFFFFSVVGEEDTYTKESEVGRSRTVSFPSFFLSFFGFFFPTYQGALRGLEEVVRKEGEGRLQAGLTGCPLSSFSFPFFFFFSIFRCRRSV